MQMRSFVKINPTTGKLIPSMLLFALPIAFGSILQTLFNACDLIVVRMSADSVAVASVGATSTVTTLFVTSTVGISSGVNIVLARLLGAGDTERAKRFISTALLFAVALGAVVSVVGLIFGDEVLRLMNCPENCFEGARTYFIVYVLAAPFILLYNFAATIIRVDGDTVRPLMYLVCAGVTNVVLNLVLCSFLENKVLAVALATVTAQFLGAAFTMLRLIRMDGPCAFSLRDFTFDFSLCKLLLRYGIPGAITNATFAISGLLIQGAINSFGSSAVAGNTGASNVENLINSIAGGLHSAIAVFIGQNIGAKKQERVKRAFLYGTLLSCGLIFVLSEITFLLRVPLLTLFVGEDALGIASGSARFVFVMQFNVIYCLRGCLRSALNAFGYSKFTMIESLLTIVVFRVFWMSLIYPLNPCLDMAYVTYLISASLAIVTAAPMLAFVYRRYKKGIVTEI